MDLQPFQQRVVEEKVVLDARLEKLDAFIGGVEILKLPRGDQDLLVRQSAAMRSYSDILRDRIARSGPPGEPRVIDATGPLEP